MSLPALKHPGYTLEDWKSWEGRWELIDGIAYDMTPSPNTAHQGLSMDLTLAIGSALKEAKKKAGCDCRLFSAPTDVFLPTGVVIPDLLVVCDPAKVSERGVEGPPDLVVEILSPSTGQKDLTTKRWCYESAGVPEYLIVYPEERRAELLVLGANGIYQTVSRTEWGGRLQILAGQLEISLG